METDADQREPEVPEPPRPQRRVDRWTTTIWLGLLIVYLSLFVSTGYLAFLVKDTSPGYAQHEEIAAITDPETKAFVIEALKQEDADHKKTRDLATQSFNVVLGALLGFLSASATSMLRRDEG